MTAVIASEVTSIMRSPTAEAPITSYLSSVFAAHTPACWTELLGQVAAVYQLELPGPSSYFVLDGAPAQAAVEACVVKAFDGLLPPITVQHEGDLVSFHVGDLGTVWATWTGGRIVAGSRAQVASARQGPGALASTWAARLATLPTGVAMAAWRADKLVAALLGVPTKSYVIVIDRFTRDPKPTFAGRLVVDYAAPADAAIAMRRIRQGELGLPDPPAELVDAFKRMRVTQAGPRLDIVFDSATFAGITVDDLQRYLAQLAAEAAVQPGVAPVAPSTP